MLNKICGIVFLYCCFGACSFACGNNGQSCSQPAHCCSGDCHNGYCNGECGSLGQYCGSGWGTACCEGTTCVIPSGQSTGFCYTE